MSEMESDSLFNNEICIFTLCTFTKLQQLSPLILHDALDIQTYFYREFGTKKYHGY